MDDEVVCLAPDVDILAAVSFLLDNPVTGITVVNDEREVLGILTERECLSLMSGGSQNLRPEGVVADFMTCTVKTVPPDMNIYFAAGMFLNDSARRYPVVEDGKLVGMITRFDILRAIRAYVSTES